MTEDEKPNSVAAESQAIRQNLVNTAVTFLLNSDVVNKPADNKAAFLKKKGLTEAEINLAFEQANIDSKHENVVAIRDNLNSSNPLPPPYHHYNRQYSFWTQLSTISSSLIVLGVALFGLQRFYKLYIEPWLFGKESEEGRFSQMEQQLLEVNRSLSQLKRTVSTLEETINLQKAQMDKFFQNEVNQYMPTPLAIQDLKAEVGSVKSLLLGRHQFPAMPKVSPIIPIWQLPATENENKNASSNEDKESEQESRDSVTEVTGTETVECNGNVVKDSTMEDLVKDVKEVIGVLTNVS